MGLSVIGANQPLWTGLTPFYQHEILCFLSAGPVSRAFGIRAVQHAIPVVIHIVRAGFSLSLPAWAVLAFRPVLPVTVLVDTVSADVHRTRIDGRVNVVAVHINGESVSVNWWFDGTEEIGIIS